MPADQHERRRDIAAGAAELDRVRRQQGFAAAHDLMLLPFHPLADLFPLLEGEEFEELVADVRAHGVREPIWLYEGLILDGRNRYRAAQTAGVECPTRIYDGDDPVGFVISLNLKRRHLTTSQRAMIAAKLATLRQGARTDLSPIGEMSQQQAAELLNVGKRSVERAAEVRDSGNADLIEAVEHGTISVSGAAEQVRRGIVTGVAMDSYAERGHDVYETPPAAVWPILTGREGFPGDIWEPACCRGNIVRVLRLAGYRVVASDLVDYGFPGAEAGVDFLKQTSAPPGVETIVTNPPFMHADEFVRHALKLVPHVVMLLRVLFIETVGRSDIIEGGRLRRMRVFRERIETHRDGWTGPRASNPMALAWYEWDRNYNGPIILDRISCELPLTAAPYDANDDICRGVEVGFEAIRARKAAR